MKTLLLFFSFNIFMFSQPIVTINDVGTPFSAIQYSGSFTSSQIITTGSSQSGNLVVDITGLITNYSFFVETVSPNEFPCLSEYPTGNYCEKSYDNNSTSFGLYKKTTNSFQAIAQSNEVNCSPLNFSPAYPLPFTFLLGAGWSNPTLPPKTNYGDYGTLITPFGTYSDVIIYSRYYNTGSSGGSGIYYDSYYYNSNPFLILFTQSSHNPSVQDPGYNFYTFRNYTTGLNLKSNEINSYKVSPNPTDNEF